MYFHIFLLLCSPFLCVDPCCWPVSFYFCLKNFQKNFLQARLADDKFPQVFCFVLFFLPWENLYFPITFFPSKQFFFFFLNFLFCRAVVRLQQNWKYGDFLPHTCVIVNTTHQRVPLLPAMKLHRHGSDSISTVSFGFPLGVVYPVSLDKSIMT